MRTSIKIAALILSGLFVVACENDGPAERLGESIDDTVDEVRDGGDKVADAVDDACEDLKDAVDAENRNC